MKVNKTNYQAQLDSIIQNLTVNNKKPRLLLHACCAPCASYCVEYLRNYFDVTILYYNPNIDSKEEYDKRASEIQVLAASFEPSIEYVICDYNNSNFLEYVKGYELCTEGGLRCERCFELRLSFAAKFAADKGYDYFASTLSISPLKNSDKLNMIGQKVAQIYSVSHLPNDFKKKGGYLRSVEISNTLGFYRQNYCGCIFSKKASNS